MITFLSSFSPITKKLIAQYLQTSQVFNYNPLNHFPKSPTISSQIFLRKTIDYFVRPRFHKITKTLGTNSVQTSELATLPNLHFTDTQTSVQASPTQVSSTFWRAKPMSRVYDSSRKNEKRLHLYLGTCEPREDLPVPWTEAIHLPFSKCALQDNRTKKIKRQDFVNLGCPSFHQSFRQQPSANGILDRSCLITLAWLLIGEDYGGCWLKTLGRHGNPRKGSAFTSQLLAFRAFLARLLRLFWLFMPHTLRHGKGKIHPPCFLPRKDQPDAFYHSKCCYQCIKLWWNIYP